MKKNRLNPYVTLRHGGCLAALCLLSVAATIASADDATSPEKKEEPKKKKWESVATAGVTLTRGNSKTFLANVSVATKRSWTNDEALLGASAGYGNNTTTIGGNKVDTTTDSYVKGFGQWNHLISTQAYAGFRLTGDHDDVAALTYRITASPLVGYYFVKEPNTSFAGEIGPSYIREKLWSENVHNYLALRIGERANHTFASGAKIWESLEWFPKVQDFQNYLVVAELGVSAPISKALSVSLVLQDNYNSRPATIPTRKLKNDVRLIAGLSYSF